MNGCSFRRTRGAGRGLAVVALLALTAVPLAAFGADKMVLGELFTSTG
ncbi:MAG: hypothetical protein JSU68_00310 [Phycisphaerales bacterium]|nr:MAG: hypothetical protein JSU68_00310 [Phycisphaerales bacterium]